MRGPIYPLASIMRLNMPIGALLVLIVYSLLEISFSILILKLESNLNKFVSRYEFYKLTVRL